MDVKAAYRAMLEQVIEDGLWTPHDGMTVDDVMASTTWSSVNPVMALYADCIRGDAIAEWVRAILAGERGPNHALEAGDRA